MNNSGHTYVINSIHYFNAVVTAYAIIFSAAWYLLSSSCHDSDRRWTQASGYILATSPCGMMPFSFGISSRPYAGSTRCLG